NTDYAGFQDGICNPNWGVLYTYVGTNHFFLAGSFLAHAVGHLLNVRHDIPGCVCFRRSSCLMDEFPTLQDMISNCSHDVLHMRIHAWDPCMSEVRRTYRLQNYHVPRCGNK
ncbi:mCG1035792, partial [Mus musculus]